MTVLERLSNSFWNYLRFKGNLRIEVGKLVILAVIASEKV